MAGMAQFKSRVDHGQCWDCLEHQMNDPKRYGPGWLIGLRVLMAWPIGKTFLITNGELAGHGMIPIREAQKRGLIIVVGKILRGNALNRRGHLLIYKKVA